MLQKHLLIFLICLTTQLFSQQSLSREALVTTLSVNNILYIGIDNPIEINLSDSLNYIYKSNNGLLFNDNQEMYSIPNHPGRTRITIAGLNSNNDTIVRLYKSFITRYLPSPQIYLDTMNMAELNVLYKDWLYENHFNIKVTDDIPDSKNWYLIDKIIITSSSLGDYASISNYGTKLTAENINQLSTLKPGQKIIIRFQLKSSDHIIYNTLIQYEIPLY